MRTEFAHQLVPYFKIFFPGILSKIPYDTISWDQRDLVEKIIWKNSTQLADSFTVTLINKNKIFTDLKEICWKIPIMLWIGYWDIENDVDSPQNIGSPISGMVDLMTVNKVGGLEKIILTCVDVSTHLGYGVGVGGEAKKKNGTVYNRDGVKYEMSFFKMDKASVGDEYSVVVQRPFAVEAIPDEKEGSPSSETDEDNSKKFASMRDSDIVKEIAVRNIQQTDHMGNPILDEFFIMKTETDYGYTGTEAETDYFKDIHGGGKKPITQSKNKSDIEIIMKLAKRNNFEFFIQSYWVKSDSRLHHCLFFVAPKLEKPLMDLIYFDTDVDECKYNNVKSLSFTTKKRNLLPGFVYWLSTKSKNVQQQQKMFAAFMAADNYAQDKMLNKKQED